MLAHSHLSIPQVTIQIVHSAIAQELDQDLWLAIECRKLPLREIRVKALIWHGKNDLRCESVPDQRIEHPRDAIIKVTACAICGFDLHVFDDVIPQSKSGYILGHETMGEVVEVGSDNKALKVRDRVVVPFTIACGECFFCQRGYYSGCERTNPDHEKEQSCGVIHRPGCSAIRIFLEATLAARPSICACLMRTSDR